jgi:hypothetical protein
MLRKGGWPSTKEPGLAVLLPQMAEPPAGAQGNLLFPLKGEQCVGDVSVMHSESATHCALAEKTDDGAVARQDADKISQYPGNSADRCVPLTVETIGRLSKPFMDLPTYVNLRSTATAPHVRAICLGRAPRPLCLLVPLQCRRGVVCGWVLCACEWWRSLPGPGPAHRGG